MSPQRRFFALVVSVAVLVTVFPQQATAAAAAADRAKPANLPVDFPEPQPRPESAGKHLPPHGAESTEPAASASSPDPQAAFPPLAQPPMRARVPKAGEEIVDKRTERSKVFATADPNRFNAKLYAGPVHFKDPHGKWADIDNTLVEGRPGRVRTRAAGFGTELAKNGRDRVLAEVRLDGSHSVGFGLNGARSSAVDAKGPKATYRDVLPHVDLELTAGYTTLKEDIVLKSKNAPDTYVFPLQLEGLTPSLNESLGSVEYKDAEGVVRATTPRGWMEDAKVDPRTGDGATSYDVDYRLLGNAEAGWSLEVKLDRAYLDDPARQYPVRVDPVVQPQSGTDDTFSMTDMPPMNNSGHTQLKVGRFTDEVDGDHTARSFLHFDTSVVLDKYINHAQVYLWEFWSWACQDEEMTIYRITEDWTGATITSFHAPVHPDIDTVTVVNRKAFHGGHTNCPATEGYKVLDASDAVRRWAARTWAQQGIALVSTAPESDVYGWKKFNSHNAGINIPLLNIDYSEPNSPPYNPDSLSPANEQLLRTNWPELRARGSDPNPGDDVQLRWRVYWAADNSPRGGHDSGNWVCWCGGFDTWTPGLADGRYRWETWAWDGQYNSGATSQYFTLDTTAPSTPSGFTSSHATGVASTNRTINVSWQPSTDATSGVKGYATRFDTDPGGDPGTSVNRNESNASTTVPGNGTYWFHVRSIDNADNYSTIAHYGPFYIDATAPTVTKVVSALTGGATHYARGQEVAYTITVTNTHPFAVNISSVQDTAPTTLLPTAGTLRVDGLACSATAPSLPDASFALPTCTLNGRAISTSGFSLAAAGQPNSTRAFTYKAVVLGGDRDCSTVTNGASATNGNGTTNAVPVPITVCEAGLGLEPWWSYVSKNLGPQALASVNPANGNLVVQATDSTPVQGHGRLAFVLRRTYNSKNSAVLDLPGSLGAGWQLNIGETGDFLAGGVGATGLYVPPAESLLTPGGVTLVDRDGTRHVFEPKGLGGQAAINVTPGASAPTGALASLIPKSLSVDVAQASICVDQTYKSPAGVHVGLWRYVRVNAVGSSACAGATPGNSSVLGFAAVRTDRVRSEFSLTGRLLALVDANGNELRYTYDAQGLLTRVHEPRNCADPTPLTCRAFRFDYSVANQTSVTDPAGRRTTYEFDTATPKRLVRVVNPDGSDVRYGYGSCNGSANQLCSVTDPRFEPNGDTSRHKTTFAYETPPGGLQGMRRLASLTDRRGTQTAFNYLATYVTADTAGRRMRFQLIDGSGRVGEIDDGDTGDVYRRVTLNTWDTAASPCRQPDNVVDNNLCRTVRQSLTTATPDEDTSWTHNAEGSIIAERRANARVNGSLTTVTSTFGYRTQYIQANGQVRVFDDAVAGNGTVTTPSSGRGDGSTLFAVTDRTQSLTPRGNAAGAGFAPYRTTVTVDNNSSKPVNAVTSGTCGTPDAPSGNTGNVCETSGPAFAGSTPTVTRATYDGFGQKATTTSAKAIAEAGTGTPAATIYTYYTDANLDLSNGVSAGGWLKAVTDPGGEFVAFGYDRAGNVARTWDRSATDKAAVQFGVGLSAYPGTVSSPPSNEYTEELRATGSGTTPFANPWRYVRSTRDQLGKRTTVEAIDRNGNPLTVRTPRGNEAGSASFDVTSTYDDGDMVLTQLQPEERADNKPTKFTYDARGNLKSETDPNGSVKTHHYDSVDRRTETRFTRMAWPDDPQQVPLVVPQACRESTGDDAPILPDKVVCSTTTAYDGVDNVIGSSDADAQATTADFDGVHRQVRALTPRGDANLLSRRPDGSTTMQLRTETLYDADGNATTQCPPRQFAVNEGNAVACTASGVFSEHVTFDVAGRVSTVTTYRAAGQPITASTTYDADGNQFQATDGAGRVTTTHYDLLGRKTALEVPRVAGIANITSWRYSPSGDVLTVVRPGRIEMGTGSDGDLVVSGATYPRSNPFVLAPGKQYRHVTLQNGGWMTAGAGTVGELRAAGTITVCSTCGIDVSGRGAAGGAGLQSPNQPAQNGQGPGGGSGAGAYINHGGGGGGHYEPGGAGTSSTTVSTSGAGGGTYGGTNRPEELSASSLLGSGGGGGTSGNVVNPGGSTGGNGGAGGGALHISANRLVVRGTITAAGAPGGAGTGLVPGGGGGGGSGGTLWLSAPIVDASGGGVLDVSGGLGGGEPTTGMGGRGGNGRLRIDSDTFTGPTATHMRPAGRVTAHDYDAKHRLVLTVDGSDHIDADQAGMTSADGGTNVRTAMSYDAEDRVVARFEPRAFQASVTADARFIARTEYDRDGRPVASYVPRYADGSTFDDPTLGVNNDQATQCSTSNRPPAVNGVPSYPSNVGVCVTRVEYDAGGRVVKHVLPTVAGSANRHVTISYTDDGLTSSTNTPSPAAENQRVTASSVTYDGSGRPKKATDALGLQTVMAYFQDGLVRTVTEQPSGSTSHVTSYGYNAAGMQTSVTDALGRTATAAYFADGRQERSIDTGGNISRYVYDNVGNPIEVYSPSAMATTDANNTSNTPTTHAYTQDNLLLTSTQPVASDGSVRRRTTYGYDAAGRKVAQSNDRVNGSGGLIDTGGAQRFAYYDTDRPSVETGRDGGTITKAYDAAGNATRVTNSASGSVVQATYYLDSLERTVDDGTRTVRSSYDGSGNRTARVDALNAAGTSKPTAYRHGDAGLPIRGASAYAENPTAQLGETNNFKWTYDAAGRIATESTPKNQVSTYTLNNDDTVQNLSVTVGGQSIASWTYTWDNLRRQTSQAFSGVGAGGAVPVTTTLGYEYDNANRLSKFTDATGARNLTWDPDGNRLSFGSQQFTYNADDSIKTATDSTGGNSKTYSYHSWGGLSDDGCAAYAYDGFDRTTAVASRTGSGCGTTARTTSYTYDGFDRQTSRTEDGTRTDFAYDGLRNAVVAETKGADRIEIALSPNGIRKAYTKNGSSSPAWYLADDGSGNISTVTNGGSTASSAVSCTVRFDPYGAPLSAQGANNPCNTGSTENTAFYRGARRDEATGAYQFGSRTYDPAKAAFLTPDGYRADDSAKDLSVGVDPMTNNRYSYVNGDPVNLVDPTGHEAWWQCPDGDCDPNNPNSDSTPAGMGMVNKEESKTLAEQREAREITFVLDLVHPLTGLNYADFTEFQKCAVDAYVPANGRTWSSRCQELRSTVLLRREVIELEIRYSKSWSLWREVNPDAPLFPEGYETWSDAQRREWLGDQNMMTKEDFYSSVVSAGIASKTANGAKALLADDVIVLGKQGQYLTLADDIGARAFNVPEHIWAKMSVTQRWEANQKFLDRAIARGAEIRLATPISKETMTGFYRREIQYLQSQGYVPSADGTRMIRGGA